jgi:O-antigen biosynthesis protein
MSAWIEAIKMRVRLLNRRRLRKRHARRGRGYDEWVATYDTIGPAERTALQTRLQALSATPVIAVLMPVYNPPPALLREAIASVQAQIYPHWELCIADDASTDAEVLQVLQRAAAADQRIRLMRRQTNGHISRSSNDALALVTAPYVALLDHDDLLREHALLLVAEALAHAPQAEVLYSDEDKLAIDGQRCDPYFKPDWNPELLLAQNYLCHLVTYRTALVRKRGGFRVGFEGAQDHDLVLRCTEGLAPGQIVHIPHVLYHWRQHAGSTAGRNEAKPYAQEAGLRAVREALARRTMDAQVELDAHGWYAVRMAAPVPEPRVSIIVPTRDGITTLPRCFESLVQKTRYGAWELLVIDNGSHDPAFLAELQRIARHPRVRVLRDDSPFNYAALNNRAVSLVDSEFVVLLNDDTEVLSPDWLSQLVGWAAQPGVGAVGARLWYPDGTLQHAGVVLGIGDVAGHAHRHWLRDEVGHRGRAVVLQDFSAVTAACLAVRRSSYLQVGGLDAQHFAVAFNDVDFCLKLGAAGLRNVWVPTAELVHHESVTRGSDREARHRQRYEKEAALMRQRWGREIAADPAYNPNLTLAQEDFGLAFPPRVGLLQPPPGPP